ncbi:MAG: hypothetical protein IJA67_04925 [Oscillospiraceae bacterium]|nr:hypothetical protein [Oscillospiraceae bacterium]
MNQKKKKEPWRYIVSGIAFAYIVYMWIEKDVLSTLTTIPAEQTLPIIIISIFTTLLKVALYGGGAYLIHMIIKNRKEQ